MLAKREAREAREAGRKAEAQAPAGKPLEDRFNAARLTAQQRLELLELLKSPDRPSYSQLAQQYGTSISKVHRLASQIDSSPETIPTRRLRRYARQLAKRLPIDDRCSIYEDLARGDADEKMANVQLNALKRIEELEGIVTAKERREGADNSGAGQPMFVLPAGSRIAVAVTVPNTEPKPMNTKEVE